MSDNGRSQNSQADLLIVGAGPTGLTLACLCRQLGVNLRIIDKNPGPSTTSKAIGLQYRVSEVLASMGVVDRFLERGSSPTPVNIYDGQHRLVRFQFDLAGRHNGRDAFTPCPIMIPQSETEKLLGDLLKVRGGKIEWNTEFLTFDQRDTEVLSTVRRGDGSVEEIASKWLVSCEGAHSVIRKQARILFTGKTYPLAFVLADVEIDWSMNHNENHVWMHKDGAFAALPLPSGPNIWRLFSEVSLDADVLSEKITLAAVQRLTAARTGFGDVQVRNPIWLSDFKINCRMVDRFRAGRVFVAGDAAHIHSPTGGQGITTGVQDAANLAWKLGRVLRGAPESLLDTYQEERLPKAKEVLAETDRTTTVFFSTKPLIRLLRDYVVLPILRMKVVQKRMFGKLSQLHVNYRGSRLSQDEVKGWLYSRRLVAGDRAPDVAFQYADSAEIITLFKLLQSVRPVVLIGTGTHASDSGFLERLLRALTKLDLPAYVLTTKDNNLGLSDKHCFVDIYGDFHQLYGLDKDYLCLIRPDGHIGLIQRPVRADSLKSYLRTICSVELVNQVFTDLLN
jgi:2-polyprenyl-6-methoxyphenol hydroxylase-like FAD-dependent oxidoreductase